jgi:hypothetical protein
MAQSIRERARILWDGDYDNRTAVSYRDVHEAVAVLATRDARFSYRTVRGMTTFTVSASGPNRVVDGEVRRVRTSRASR